MTRLHIDTCAINPLGFAEGGLLQKPDIQVKLTDIGDEQFDRHVLDLSARELGAGGFVRYLMTYRTGSGDDTRDRHKWLTVEVVDDIYRESGLEPLRRESAAA